MVREVRWGEVGVSLPHVQCLPTARVFQNHEWRASLYMPTCPGVPQVVTVKVADANFGASAAKTASINLTDLADDAVP